MEVLVVGAGEMGEWVGRTLSASVAFADHDSERARDAAAAVEGARAVSLDVDERFDAVCVAVPMSAATAAIEAHAERAGAAMVDVTGSMAEPIAAAREALPDGERASFHPLFAPPRAPGQIACVTDAAGPTVARIVADFDAAGNDVFETAPEEHDEAMATVQSGAHAAVLAYALGTESVPERFHTPVSASLRELVTTVVAGSPDVYAEIASTFDGGPEVVADAAADLAAADEAAFADRFEQIRERVDADARSLDSNESPTSQGSATGDGETGEGSATGDGETGEGSATGDGEADEGSATGDGEADEGSTTDDGEAGGSGVR